MLSSRLIGLSLRSYSRFSSLSRCGPFHLRIQLRGFAKETKKKPKLLEQLSEDNELAHCSSWRSYAIPTVILVVAGAGMFIHYNDERRAILKGTKESTSESSSMNRPAIGGPFKLIDTEDHLVTEADLKGNWTLIYFGYTSCPDIGPHEVQKMAKAIDILEAENNINITPVFITIDPQRDTPAQLRAYLREFHPRIIGLTGPIDSVRQIAQEYRVYFKKVDEEGQDYLVQCSKNMYLMDPNMETMRFYGVEYDAAQLADDIAKEVKKASK